MNEIVIVLGMGILGVAIYASMRVLLKRDARAWEKERLYRGNKNWITTG